MCGRFMHLCEENGSSPQIHLTEDKQPTQGNDF